MNAARVDKPTAEQPHHLLPAHRSRTSGLIRLLAGLAVAAALAPLAYGQSSLTVAWDRSVSAGVASYRLYRGGSSGNYTTTLSTGGATTATVSNLTAGATYYFAVTAVDTNGLESSFSNEVSYQVPAATNVAPTIVLTSPGGGTTYTAPATITLAASVVPNNHTISQVQFYNGSTLLGSDTSSPFSFTWNNVAAGTYLLSAKLVYDSGSSVSSSAASVTVTAATTNTSLTFAATSGSYTAPFVASNGRLSQPSETGVTTGGRAAYNFNVSKTGNYVVSATVLAANEAQNSFFVNMDAEPADPTMIWDVPVFPVLTNQTVAWRGTGTSDPATAQYRPRVFYLTAGTHQLIIRGREANASLGTITIALAPTRIRIRQSSSYTSSASGPQSPVPAGVVLGVDGQPGALYTVMASTDLRTWAAIGTFKVDDNGSGEFTDPAGTSLPARYYRLQEP